jgi:hypothetical protein
MQTLTFTVKTTQIAIQTAASSSDQAVKQVLDFEGAPFSALVSVYQDDPVPDVSCKYGAPHGRRSANLDHDGPWKAEAVELDEGGYDKGGCYWGLRKEGISIYAVQDGMGNIAFVDASSPESALVAAAA